MDVFWFRIAKAEANSGGLRGNVEPGRLLVMIDRGDYWQCAFLIPKGAAEAYQAAASRRSARRSRRRRRPNCDVVAARRNHRPASADRQARPADLLASARVCSRSAMPRTPCRRSAGSASISPSRTRSPPRTSSPARLPRGEDVDPLLQQGPGAPPVPDAVDPGARRRLAQDRIIGRLLQSGRADFARRRSSSACSTAFRCCDAYRAG